jgi:hypothetical protein
MYANSQFHQFGVSPPSRISNIPVPVAVFTPADKNAAVVVRSLLRTHEVTAVKPFDQRRRWIEESFKTAVKIFQRLRGHTADTIDDWKAINFCNWEIWHALICDVRSISGGSLVRETILLAIDA